MVAVMLSLLAGCGVQRYVARSPHAPAARAWARAHELSEWPAVELVAGARVLGLGEAAHGALDVFLARAELTRQLVTGGWARTLVLEADVRDVCALNRYVHGDGDDLRGALAATIGLYNHEDSAEFFAWLRAHNRGSPPESRVSVRGMDAQSPGACASDDSPVCPGRASHCAQTRTLRDAPNLGDTYFARDEIMAANVLGVAAESSGGVIVWAHSGHVSRSAPLLHNGRWSQTAPMGWFLARTLGAAYVPMTVTFRRGAVSVTALRGGLVWPRFAEQVSVSLADPPGDTVEGLLGGERAVLIDLRTLPAAAGSTAWFAAPRLTRSVGAAEHVRMLERGTVARGWGHYVPREAFDVVLVLPETRPLRPWFANAGQ